MHPALKKEYENLKELAKRKNKSIVLMETQLENVVFISSNEKLACLVIVEEEIHNLLTCFKVDLNKWKYAHDEGFGSENIPNNLAKEILIKLNSPTEYLKYLGI